MSKPKFDFSCSNDKVSAAVSLYPKEMFVYEGDLMYTQKPPVTSKIVSSYYESYLQAHPMSIIMNEFLRHSDEFKLQNKRNLMFVTTIQIHLLNVRVKKVNTETVRFENLLRTIVPYKENLEKIISEKFFFLQPSSLAEISTIEINTIIDFWNLNPSLFAEM